MQEWMRAAKQLDLLGHIGQGRVDLLVGDSFLWLHCKAAHLEQIDRAIPIDGEFDVDRVAGEQRLELTDEREEGGEFRRASIRSGT